mmetsp:Transcript_136415/g.237166  ORF Transcript_136415/g.237166 Transcript_136415/m.237166 type:complete len:243 (-) Transcript_136415:2030-2758(-)
MDAAPLPARGVSVFLAPLGVRSTTDAGGFVMPAPEFVCGTSPSALVFEAVAKSKTRMKPGRRPSAEAEPPTPNEGVLQRPPVGPASKSTKLRTSNHRDGGERLSPPGEPRRPLLRKSRRAPRSEGAPVGASHMSRAETPGVLSLDSLLSPHACRKEFADARRTRRAKSGMSTQVHPSEEPCDSLWSAAMAGTGHTRPRSASVRRSVGATAAPSLLAVFRTRSKRSHGTKAPPPPVAKQPSAK